MNTSKKLRRLLGLCAFVLGFVLLVILADLYFIKTDTIASLTLHEMKQREDIDLAFVGSSIVRDHFNAPMITELTGKNAFCATIPTASTPGSIALMQELYKTSSPEWVVLVTEPYNFLTVQESTEAFYKLAPYLSDVSDLTEYFLRVGREDGLYLDRLLMFREFGADSPADVMKTIGLRYAPEKTYEKLLSTLDPTISYHGGGFLRHETDERADDLFRESVHRIHEEHNYYLYEGSKEHLLSFKQLCEENGSKLMVVIYPNHTAHLLADRSFMDLNDALEKFCDELGVPCFNFSYALPELMPRLDSYFFDLYHMVGEGADLLSSAFARVFNGYTAGEDVSSLFYESRWQYLDNLSITTNCWITPYRDGDAWNPALYQDEARVRELCKSKDVYLADCNHYTEFVPEYRFVLKHPDGSEELLQDYGVDTLYACDRDSLAGKTLRLYARIQNHEENGEVWYDLTIE